MSERRFQTGDRAIITRVFSKDSEWNFATVTVDAGDSIGIFMGKWYQVRHDITGETGAVYEDNLMPYTVADDPKVFDSELDRLYWLARSLHSTAQILEERIDQMRGERNGS